MAHIIQLTLEPVAGPGTEAQTGPVRTGFIGDLSVSLHVSPGAGVGLARLGDAWYRFDLDDLLLRVFCETRPDEARTLVQLVEPTAGDSCPG